MQQNSLPESRWFSLSGKELRTVGVLAAIALLTCGVVYLAREYRWSEVEMEGGSDLQATPARLNVNSAKAYELELLPGVGPKTAAAIVKDRRANGPFDGLNDLQRVKGIGPATVEDIRPHAMCAPPPAGRDDSKAE